MDAIYLDHAATTPLRPEVRSAMEPFLEKRFGNPSSTHRWGREASAALAEAREEAAEALGARAEEIHFLSGGTEADNLALLGRSWPLGPGGQEPGGVVISTLEHSAIREPAELLEMGGGRVDRVPVTPDGTVDLVLLDDALDAAPELVSFAWVNNEVGVRLPVEEVANRARNRGVPVHSDAVQAIGRVPVEVDRALVDLLTVSGHKLGGPRGTGLLYVRKGVELAPRTVGGGQEGGLRSGTVNVAGAVGLARALSLAVEEREAEAERMAHLRDELEALLRDGIPELLVHGADAFRAPHILSVGLPGLPADVLLAALDAEGVAASAGSACMSGTPGPGPALQALYGLEVRDRAPLRFSLGRTTTAREIQEAAERTVRVVNRVAEAETV